MTTPTTQREAAEITQLRAELTATKENLRVAVHDAWKANAALTQARAAIDQSTRQAAQADASTEQNVWIAYNSADDDEPITFFIDEMPGEELKARFDLRHYLIRPAPAATDQPSAGLGERAAFDAAFLSLNGFHTKDELAREWAPGSLSGEMFRAGYLALKIGGQ